MRRGYSRPHQSEQGQIVVLLALATAGLLILIAFVVDGGFGLVQMRSAQNAADFASLAASKLMPCNVGANGSVTGAQVQQTIQNVVNDNMRGVTTSWTGQYLTSSGSAISGATFSGTSALAPPSNACGVSVQVKGTWSSFLAGIGGFRTISAQEKAGAVGSGGASYNLAIASLLPYARHTIYAGSIGSFNISGSMYDNSVAQCGDRSQTCENYSQCLSGTPLSNITCYGDSADVFQESSESISGTLYSVAPVALDPCFYEAPSSGTAYPMSSSSQYYIPYACFAEFSSSSTPEAYAALQGNVSSIGDPLSALPDPSANADAAAVCPGQSSAHTSSGGTFASGSLTPGVYTSTVVITGSVTFLPCQQNGNTVAPGIYVFQDGLEICPTSGATVTGNDVMFFNEAAPPPADTNSSGNAAYCAADVGPSGAPVPDGIDIGGASGTKVNLTAPNTGPFYGISLYQSRSTNLNIGLDDGWTNSNSTYTADGASITINGVVYDNSFSNEPSNEVFSYMGSSYEGPYGSLCTGSTSDANFGDPTPCPDIPTGVGLTNTSGTVTINGAVIVGAFGTQGGSSGSPLAITINFDAGSVPPSVGGIKLIF